MTVLLFVVMYLVGTFLLAIVMGKSIAYGMGTHPRSVTTVTPSALDNPAND